MYLMSRQYLNQKTEVSKLPLLLKDDGRLTDERLLKVANVLNHSIFLEYPREGMLVYIYISFNIIYKGLKSSAKLREFFKR